MTPRPLLAALAATLVAFGTLTSLTGCERRTDPPAANDSTVAAELSPMQQNFETTRTGELEHFRAATDDAQRDAVFRQTNTETDAAVARLGGKVSDWLGTVDTLNFREAVDPASGIRKMQAYVAIRSPNHVSYRTNYDIWEGTPMYAAAEALRVGQPVRFSGKLERYRFANGSIQYETSVTKEASFSAPTFDIVLSALAAVNGGTPEPRVRATN